MSLINRMLQDLDQRQAIGGDREGLPEQVVLPAQSPRRRKLTTALSVALLLSLAGFID